MAEIPSPDALSMLSWNISCGGFDNYDLCATVPRCEGPIQELVTAHRVSNPSSAVTLLDAYRWDSVYGGNAGIAAHLGYPEARFVPLDDERLRLRGQDGIGIAFATNRHIEESGPLDLETRQGLRVILEVGKYGLQIANVYLDDLSEDTRLRQIRALLAGLEPGIPTLLVGDFNTLRPDMTETSAAVRARDLAARLLGLMLPKRLHLGSEIESMNKRQVVPLIESQGYKDADNQKRPTAPAKLPIFGIDYVFHNEKVIIDDVAVLPLRRRSDHRPITFVAAPSAVT